MYFRINSDWLWENHPPDTRFSTMIYVSENVLTPEVLQAMYRHKKAIDSIKTKYNDTWGTMCKKYRSINYTISYYKLYSFTLSYTVSLEMLLSARLGNFFSSQET